MTLTLNKKDTQVEEAKTNDTLKLDSPEHICSNNTWQIYAFLLQRNAVMYQKWYRIWYDDNISTYKTKPTSTFMNLSVSITHSISLFSSSSIFLKPHVCWSRPPKALIPCYHCDLSLASLCILSANLSIIMSGKSQNFSFNIHPDLLLMPHVAQSGNHTVNPGNGANDPYFHLE